MQFFFQTLSQFVIHSDKIIDVFFSFSSSLLYLRHLHLIYTQIQSYPYSKNDRHKLTKTTFNCTLLHIQNKVKKEKITFPDR